MTTDPDRIAAPATPPRSGGLIRGTLFYGAGLGSALAFGALWNVLLARLLGPTDRGIVAVFEVTAMFAASFSLPGLEMAYLFHAGRRTFSKSLLFSTTLFATVLGASFGAAVLFILRNHVIAVEILREGIYTYLAMYLILMLALSTSLGAVYIAADRPQDLSFILAMNGVVKCVALISLSFFSRTYLAGIMASIAASTFLVAAGISLLRVRRNLPSLVVPRIRAGVTLLKTGLNTYLGGIFQMLSFRLDALVLAAIAGPRATGYYAVAVGVSEVLSQLPAAASVMLFTRASETSKEGASSDRLVYRLTVAATAALALVVGLVSPWLIPLVFGDSFRPSVAALLWLLPGTLALSLWRLGAGELGGRGAFRVRNLSALVGLVMTIVLDLLLIPRFAEIGAAVASSASYFLMTAALLPFLLKSSGDRLSALTLLRAADVRFVSRRVADLLRSRRKDRT